jgi:hypothetical protein
MYTHPATLKNFLRSFKLSQPEHQEHGQAIKTIHNHLFYTIIHNFRSILQDKLLYRNIHRVDRPRGLVVRVSDYWSWGPGFDSRFYQGDLSLKGKIPMVPMVWVV